MSATGRGAERDPLDDYESPPWTVQRLLDRVHLPAGDWLENAAGKGGVIQTARAHPSGARIRSFTGVELNEARHGAALRAVADRAVFGDFLKLAPTLGRFATAIGNTPYEPGLEFVVATLAICDVVALLFRHNFLGSAARWSLWRRAMPDTYLLPQRPTFVLRARRTEDGRIDVTSNDSTDYAWFVWRREELPRAEGRCAVLDLTEDDVLTEARRAAPVLFEDSDGTVRRITQDELRALRDEARELRATRRGARKAPRLREERAPAPR